MEIRDYDSLVQAVSHYLHRDDLNEAIAGYIQLAQARLNRDLKLQGERGDRGVVLAQGERRLRLPLDFNGFLSLWGGSAVAPFDRGGLRWREVAGSWSQPLALPAPLPAPPGRRLHYVDGRDLAVRDRPGRPRRFSILGAWLLFECPAEEDQTYRLHYLRAFALSEASPTNYLLEHHPDAYLYATLLEAPVRSFDDDRLVVYQDRYDRAIESITAHEADALGDDVMSLDFGGRDSFSILEG